MPRPDKARPPALHFGPMRPEDANTGLDDLFNRGQIVGNVNCDDLEFMGELGRGNGGFVTKVKHRPSNQILARKVIHLDITAGQKNQIMKELEFLKECNSPYIVGYFGACHRNGEINLFMEYMDGKSLDSILTKTTRIPEEIVGKITVAVIKGLNYLKDLNMIHRDIKPSNILLNSHGHIKICDFGVSGQLINSIARTFVGTRHYMAPERLLGGSYTVQSDIWSLGVTLVESALGIYPIPQHDPIRMYEGESSPEASEMTVFSLMECIINQPPPTIPGPPIFSSDFKDFVDRCLKRLPEERFDLRTIVQHPFVIESEKRIVQVDLWVCQVCLGSVGPLEGQQISPGNRAISPPQ